MPKTEGAYPTSIIFGNFRNPREGLDPLKLSAVGEFGLIERLAAVLGSAESGPLLLGIGDDAAVWKPAPDRVTVATADSLVAVNGGGGSFEHSR